VDRAHEPRQQVLVFRETHFALLLYDLSGQRVNHFNRFPKPFLAPHVEKPLRLPHRRRESHGSFRRQLRRQVKANRELGHRQRPLQTFRVQPEGETANAVEGESPEHVLQVQHDAVSS